MGKRYIFISDVHGEYDKMILSLNAVNFDKNKDVLVSLGDLFDRGPDSKKVLEFVMSCPKRILIWGNHDLRLQELVDGAHYNKYDRMNGVPDTVRSFLGENISDWAIPAALFRFSHCETIKLLRKYFKECVFAAEWDNLIATHAWLPHISSSTEVLLSWRNIKSKEVWTEATWSDTERIFKYNSCYPNKPLIVGHWHAWRLAISCGEHRMKDVGDGIDCSTFISPNGKLIAIDGCANYEYGGVVNTYVYEDSTGRKPILY